MSSTAETVAAWKTAIAELRRAWASSEVAAPDNSQATVGTWGTRLQAMRQEEREIRMRGAWSRGPSDLLTVARLERWELAHSAVLAWLCDPEGRHGLGAGFLGRLLERAGMHEEIGDVLVSTEVARDESRADVIVHGGTWQLVIEVKVDAVEGDLQCKRLHSDWHAEPGTRFVLLTRSGSPPDSAGDCADDWLPVTWSSVVRMLSDALADERAAAGASGRPAAEEYLRTARRIFGEASA